MRRGSRQPVARMGEGIGADSTWHQDRQLPLILRDMAAGRR